jgi:DNA polymerase/3'-5' exonuclease PolX
MNTLIINQFNLLLTDNTKNKYELNSYKKVIDIISKLEFKITKSNINKLKDIKYIGTHTIKRIEEILENGKLAECDNDAFEISKLTSIHGIGIVKSQKLYQKKITFNNIDTYLDELTHEQQIGVKYKNDILEKIPRKEITQFKTKFKTVLKKYNKDLEFEICGSYRRGNKTSGDIDVLITNNNKKNNIQLQNLIEYLTESNILIDHLTLHGNKKYMGLTKIDKIARRIDIRLVPREYYYYALLYFTGSDKTNKYMREIAKTKGWKLNEYELIDDKNKNFIVKSEEEIFIILDIDYIEPKNR